MINVNDRVLHEGIPATVTRVWKNKARILDRDLKEKNVPIADLVFVEGQLNLPLDAPTVTAKAGFSDWEIDTGDCEDSPAAEVPEFSPGDRVEFRGEVLTVIKPDEISTLCEFPPSKYFPKVRREYVLNFDLKKVDSIPLEGIETEDGDRPADSIPTEGIEDGDGDRAGDSIPTEGIETRDGDRPADSIPTEGIETGDGDRAGDSIPTEGIETRDGDRAGDSIPSEGIETGDGDRGILESAIAGEVPEPKFGYLVPIFYNGQEYKVISRKWGGKGWKYFISPVKEGSARDRWVGESKLSPAPVVSVRKFDLGQLAIAPGRKTPARVITARYDNRVREWYYRLEGYGQDFIESVLSPADGIESEAVGRPDSSIPSYRIETPPDLVLNSRPGGTSRAIAPDPIGDSIDLLSATTVRLLALRESIEKELFRRGVLTGPIDRGESTAAMTTAATGRKRKKPGSSGFVGTYAKGEREYYRYTYWEDGEKKHKHIGPIDSQYAISFINEIEEMIEAGKPSGEILAVIPSRADYTQIKQRIAGNV